jgi:hypothetical protein
MSELSPSTKALLRAARQDGPDALARTQIWSGVGAQAAEGGAAALGAAGGKAAVSAATAKLFVMGALLGSAVTVGVAAMVLGVGAPRLQADPAVFVRAETESEAVVPAARTTPAVAKEAPASPFAAAPPVAPHGALAKHAGADHAHATEDSLGREAELVAEARGAVVRGEPAAALRALHAAQGLPAHALEPEELSLEVKALRALGRLDEANAADARLRARFPDHALAR